MGKEDDKHHFIKMVSIFATYQFGIVAAIIIALVLILLLIALKI